MIDSIHPKTVLIVESQSELAVPLNIWPARYEIITSTTMTEVSKILHTEKVDLLAISCGKSQDEMSNLIADLSIAAQGKHIPLLVLCNLEQPISILPGSQHWSAKIGLAHTLTDKKTLALTIQNLESSLPLSKSILS